MVQGLQTLSVCSNGKPVNVCVRIGPTLRDATGSDFKQFHWLVCLAVMCGGSRNNKAKNFAKVNVSTEESHSPIDSFVH